MSELRADDIKTEAKAQRTEIEVTPQMIEAGSQCLWGHWLPPSLEEMPLIVSQVYQVMEAVRRGDYCKAEMLSSAGP